MPLRPQRCWRTDSRIPSRRGRGRRTVSPCRRSRPWPRRARGCRPAKNAPAGVRTVRGVMRPSAFVSETSRAYASTAFSASVNGPVSKSSIASTCACVMPASSAPGTFCLLQVRQPWSNETPAARVACSAAARCRQRTRGCRNRSSRSRASPDSRQTPRRTPGSPVSRFSVSHARWNLQVELRAWRAGQRRIRHGRAPRRDGYQSARARRARERVGSATVAEKLACRPASSLSPQHVWPPSTTRVSPVTNLPDAADR